ncbi:TetR/AcrR family transcriptional regulator [Cognatishimia sp. SS12]|uniref:TetR/AcrR family transcriptional regulator n=1 Tax=Cognatishimia sp. SS12 TaxID=2979465 RepID=UPI00232C2211|nr:TetR/AcrR family transcriptional regulator [Cognatishimia sp. SS12]MDC0739219.1 TetR/AcrR family transcriptional regulator [Cognatishimia sp. SS12]
MAKNRLSPEAWVAAGFRALASQGPAALKAEPLARSLGTTKGSFYWHFADVPAFHAAMLTLWEERAFANVVRSLESEDNPIQRLRALGAMAAEDTSEEFGGRAAEPAIRAWARDNTQVAEGVARVDAKRMEYLNALLADIGLSNPELSRILYGALIGMQELSLRDGAANAPALATLVDLILALYEEE